METNNNNILTNESISFEKSFNRERYSLIQVTKSLAAEIRQSKTFVIRSRREDNICFCTDFETYRVKEVETTDTLFVTNKIEPPRKNDNENGEENEKEIKEYNIKAYLQSFLELTKEESSPYLALKELFKKYIYNPKNNYSFGDENETKEKITMNDLLNQIQFSEYEIKQSLLPVAEINGFLVYLSRETRSQLLDKLIELIDDPEIPSISLKKIKFDDLRIHFDENIPDSFIHWIIQTYSNENGSINRKNLCRDRAISFFEKNHEISLKSFERSMIRLLPIGLEMDLTNNNYALQGIALFKNSIVHGTLIDYVNVEDLPNNPTERLNLLFKIKDSWTMEELEPYVIDFCINKTAIPAFLLKNCQQIKDGNNNSRKFVKKDNNF